MRRYKRVFYFIFRLIWLCLKGLWLFIKLLFLTEPVMIRIERDETWIFRNIK